MARNVRLLLTTICKPYGVKDRYAEALGMQMELANNQMSKEQHIHSPRGNYWTFPLYFLAENTSVPTVVLDFPSWQDFTRELRKGYTHIGISFIQTNVYKARRMAEYIRRKHPETKILLGGYGTALPDLEEKVPHDALCHGEGIRWIREYFGDNIDAPVRHPVMFGTARKHVYGVPVDTTDSAVIFPGLGCTNGCFFCCSSHKFGKQYIPLLPTGRAVFDVCREAEEKLGVREFAILDENFLKTPDRARDLLALMEAHKRNYHFWIFSSAEAIAEVGIDFLVRLGVCAVWIGIETRAPVFEKLQKIDARALIEDMQTRGISVLSSSILFLEHHNQQTLWEDVEWAIDFGTDLHQFMQLTPLAGTPLFEQYQREGRLIPGFPETRMSGLHSLNFRHPHFEPGEVQRLTRAAFRRKYERDGPAMVNMARTALHGYESQRKQQEQLRSQGLGWNPDTLEYDRPGCHAPDQFMERRLEMLKTRAERLRCILLVAALYAPNREARSKCRDVARRYRKTLGPPAALQKLLACILVVSGTVEYLRHLMARLCGRTELVRQPPSRRVEYRMDALSGRGE